MDSFQSKVDQALAGQLKLDRQQREHLLELGMNNFQNIPEAVQ